MHIIRRALVIVAVVFALTTTGATAHAAPTPPNPVPGIGDVLAGCKKAPTPVGQWFADALDPGPATPGTDQYSMYGYAGYRIIPYDTGCADMAAQIAAEQAPDRVGDIARLFTSQGAETQSADRFFTAATFLAAATAAVTRIAFGDSQIWGVLDPVFESMRIVSGWQAIWAFTGVALLALGAWLALKRFSVDRSVTIVTKALFVLTVGVMAAMWAGNVGPYISQAVAATYRATAGITDDQNVTDAGGVVGDVFVNRLIFPAWSAAQLGDGMEDYSQRLRAASTFNRAEWELVKDNRAEYDRLVGAKNEDWRAVAEEVQNANPAAYARMTAAENSDWAFNAAAAFVGVLAGALVAGYLGGITAFGSLLVRGLIAGAPLVSLLSVLPFLRTVFDVVWAKLKVWSVAIVAATAGFVAYFTIVLRPIGNADAPYIYKAGGYLIACLLAVVLWYWRHDVQRRLKIETDLDAAKSAGSKAAKGAASAASSVHDGASTLREKLAEYEKKRDEKYATESEPVRPESTRPMTADAGVLEARANDRRDTASGPGGTPGAPGAPRDGNVVFHRPARSEASPSRSADPRQEYLERREAQQRARHKRARDVSGDTVASTVNSSRTAGKTVVKSTTATTRATAQTAARAASATVRTAGAVVNPGKAVAVATVTKPVRSVRKGK